MSSKGRAAIPDLQAASAPACSILRIPGVGGLRLLHATCDNVTVVDADRTPHRHGLWHAVAYTRGAGSCLIDASTVAVSAPFLVLTSPGQPHSFAALPGEDVVYSEVTFAASSPVRELPDWSDLLRRWTGDPGEVACVGPCTAGCANDIAAIAGRMSGVIQASHPQAATLLQGMLAEVLFSIYRHQIAEGERQAVPDPVETARRFIEANAEDPIDLAAVARVAGLSAKHLGRSFAARFGDPPMRYRQRVLMRRAAVLLRTGDLRIPQLALKLGYADHRHFSRRFRIEHGVPPGRYRSGR